jgi:hypothetical protein
MRAAKIPPDQRFMLLARPPGVPLTRWDVFRALWLTRWSGQLPDGGVLTPAGGLKCGCCGHYAFSRVRIWLHRHPQDRPVPEDLQAALRGDGPVPEWFREGGQPS